LDRALFGDDNAVADPLLADCYVEPKQVSARPIVTGRWGIGKTAMLFHRNKELTQLLVNNDDKDKTLWYIGENAMDLSSLARLRLEFSSDAESYKRALETLWKGEIVRTLSVLLYKLASYYGSPTGEHWNYITQIGKLESGELSIWRRIPDIVGIPNIVGIFIGADKGRMDALKSVQGALGKIFYGKTLEHLQACLRDIKGRVKPVLVIEPVDTPLSALEGRGMAQPLITALLNVYCSNFIPSQDQLIDIQISIPWHRYRPKDLDFPNRFPQYVGRISWDEGSLKKFINRRIEWEFKWVGRGFAKGDVWYGLFADSVVNDHCEPGITEDSFRYILRHTHYRPRDFQRLARRAVEMQAWLSRLTTDEVLLGRGGTKVTAQAVREAVRESCPETMKLDFLPEVERKYSDAYQIIKLVHGLSIPFKVGDIKKRYIREQGCEPLPSELNDIIDRLWTSGIIGVEIVPQSEQVTNSLRSILPEEGFRQYNLSGGRKKISRWYFFEYNWTGKPIELLNRYEKPEETNAQLVLHPRTFEQLLPTVNRECPIGA